MRLGSDRCHKNPHAWRIVQLSRTYGLPLQAFGEAYWGCSADTAKDAQMSKTLSAITRWFPVVIKFLVSTDDFQVPTSRSARAKRPRRGLDG